MRNTPFWWILIAIMILLDIYVFQAVKVVAHPASHRYKLIIYATYWAISISAILLLVILPYLHFEHQHRIYRTTLFAMIAGLFFAKFIAAAFFLLDDLRRGAQWIIGKINRPEPVPGESASENSISRSVFLSWAGMIAGSGLFGSLIMGFGNKYRYQVKKVKLAFDNLPASFRGLKIIHISDIHCGSFSDKAAVMKGVDKIISQNADLVLFTGDLVNNVADEMEEYMDVFNRIKAPMGVYATLGNHDYGDYRQWDSMAEKRANLAKMKGIFGTIGWRLLMNEHIVLERGGEKIAVLGIENWSAKARFPKYGDMKKAHEGSESYPFKILMSHDPSHWKSEVCRQYQDVDLMLAGHTHGMQFGVEVPGFRWSPVQYVYKEWAGLYHHGRQRLYVNRGFGFIGYPGRVGILPEITVIELS
jgi:predicted MPP superfamily phosphohydrolase